MLKVLIVDDSPTIRDILTNIFAADPQMRVVGTACHGREGVEKAKLLCPDVITMDINMPVMDGLQATRQIMDEQPTPIVIISANARDNEVETTMQALSAGALTVLAKPVGPQSQHFVAISQMIVDTVKAMSDVRVIRHRRRSKSIDTEPSRATVHLRHDATVPAQTSLKAIGIVASTGGPPALGKVLGGLPANFPVPILVVQHIVSGFVGGFATWLDSVTALQVTIARDHLRLQPGNIYIAPEDRHVGVTPSGFIRLIDAPPVDGFRPSGTSLFESLAENMGSRVAAVVMTGMGRDGASGLQKLYQAGAITIAQDEATSVVFGMPRVAIEEGAVKQVLPLERIAGYLINLV